MKNRNIEMGLNFSTPDKKSSIISWYTSGQIAMQLDSVKEEKVITPLTERKIRYTIASQLKECDLSYIDSLWQVQLSTHDIKVKTAICLSYTMLATDGASENCHNDNLLNEKKKLDTYYAGIGNEIQLDAYIYYSLLVALKSGIWNGFSFILIFVITGSLFFILTHSVKLLKPDVLILPVNSVDQPDEEAKNHDELYQLENHVIFLPQAKKLIFEKEEIELRQQLCEILLGGNLG